MGIIIAYDLFSARWHAQALSIYDIKIVTIAKYPRPFQHYTTVSMSLFNVWIDQCAPININGNMHTYGKLLTPFATISVDYRKTGYPEDPCSFFFQTRTIKARTGLMSWTYRHQQNEKVSRSYGVKDVYSSTLADCSSRD